MFGANGLFSLRRRKEWLIDASDADRRSKVRSYIKNINPAHLSPYPLKQFNEPTNPRDLGEEGIRRGDHVWIRFIPKSSVVGLSNPSININANRDARSSISSFQSHGKKSISSLSSITHQHFRKTDMVEMIIHQRHQQKISIVFSASYWTPNPKLPRTDVSLALEIFAEQEEGRSSTWWQLAHATYRENAMRYSFSRTGIRIDHLPAGVKFATSVPPVHVYEQVVDLEGEGLDEDEEDEPWIWDSEKKSAMRTELKW